MATDINLETKVRIGSVGTQRGQTVDVPIDIILLDERVTGLWSFDLTISYNADELNLLSNDEQPYSLKPEGPVTFTADNPDVFIANSNDSYVQEQQDEGVIRLSYNIKSGSSADVDSAAISTENPYRLGTLSVQIPEGAATADNTLELSLTSNTTLIKGSTADQSEAVALKASELINGFIEIDDSPKILSEASKRIDENIGKDQPVYTIRASDDTKTLVFSIEPSSGPFYLVEGESPSQSEDGRTFTQIVYLSEDPDFETTSEGYQFTIIAQDRVNESRQQVTIEINDVDDTPPTLTEFPSSHELNENLPAGSIFYTVNASDTDGDVFFRLTGPDAGLFSIGNTSGELSINQSFSFEEPLNGNTDNVYNITVVAYDEADPPNQTTQSLSITIVDVDEERPAFTDGGKVEIIIDENIGANQVIYRPKVTDQSALQFTLIDSPESDASLFTINANTGDVTLIDNPDHESKTSYQFTIEARDAVGLTTTQDVTLNIQDLDEAAIYKGSSLIFGLVTADKDLITDSRLETSNLFSDDPDGLISEYSLVTDKGQNIFTQTLETALGTIEMNKDSGYWLYTPKGDIGQSDFFDVVAIDFKGGQTFQTVEVDLYSLEEGENYDARFEGSSEASTEEEQPISGLLKVSDLEGIESVTLNQPAFGEVLFNTSFSGEQRADVSWTYSPKQDFSGFDSFTVVATDNQGQRSNRTISIDVENIDDPALIESGNQGQGIRGNQLFGQLVASDVDGALEYTILEAAQRGKATITPQGLWTYEPNDADVENDAFTVQLQDAKGGTTNTIITVALSAQLQPPAPPINNNPGQGSGTPSGSVPPVVATTPQPPPATSPVLIPSVTTSAPGSRLQNVDADNDGLLEVENTQDGALVDGNNDGIADFLQSQVAGFRLVNTGASPTHFGALTAPNGVQLQFNASPLLEADVAGTFSFTRADGASVVNALPVGLSNTFAGIVAFNLTNLTPGSNTDVTLSLPRADQFLALTDPSQHAYLKFNYVKGRFEEFVDHDGNPLYKLVDQNNDSVFDSIELTLIDGDPAWDGDGLANGVVVDPGTLVNAQRDFNGSSKGDRLIGNLLANTLRGNKGRDSLIGDLGKDTLIGGADNDRLDGGEGADLIIGGGGADRFIYRSAADSAIGQSDMIRQLTSKDRFDLRNFDADVKFEFIGNDKFSGTAGELRTTRTSLQADLDGDGNADFQVNFTNKFRLEASQLLL